MTGLSRAIGACVLLSGLSVAADPAPDLLGGDAARWFEIQLRGLEGWSWGSIGAGEVQNLGGRDRAGVPKDDHPHTGDALDTRRDLGLTKPGFSLEGALSVMPGDDDRFTLRVLDVHWKGDATLRKSFSYNDDDFVRGERVHSAIDMLAVTLDWQHRLLTVLGTDVWAGAGLGRVATNAGMPSAPGPAGGAMEDTTAYPVYARLSTSTPLGWHFSLRSDVRFAPFALPFFWTSEQRLFLGNEFAAHRSLEGEIALRFQPLRFAGLQVGVKGLWMTQHYNGEEEDHDYGNNRIHLRAVWFFAGIVVGF